MILYISESWVVKGDMLEFVEGFHHQVDRRVLDMAEKHVVDGEC